MPALGNLEQWRTTRARPLLEGDDGALTVSDHSLFSVGSEHTHSF